MAEKEATVYIVDVGASMGEYRHGRDQSDLDFAMTYVWDKITSTARVFGFDPCDRFAHRWYGRPKCVLDLFIYGDQGTANELQGEESFENISVLQEISRYAYPTRRERTSDHSSTFLPELKQLRRKVGVSNTYNGDGTVDRVRNAISAIIIAIQMITKHCKKLKYKRKIVLVTDGRGVLEEDPDSVSEITKKITEDAMELVIIGVDFDDPEYGFKEEDKDPQKVITAKSGCGLVANAELQAENEQTFKTLVDHCDGVFGTLQQAVEELGIPRLKTTRPVPSYKGPLSLGDPNEYDSAVCIDVERYPRTAIRRPLPASQYVQRLDQMDSSIHSTATILPDGDIDMPDVVGNDLTNVKNSRTYQVLDEEAPGGKRDVSRDELAKGYEYGRTAVHINETDENVTKLETQAALEIIGFIPWANYDRYMSMTVSNTIIAQRTNSKAIMALSSVIHALFELESYAIARLVPKSDKSPLILLLAPSIEVDYECLLDVQIPFTEDVRSYKFPPLDRVVTISGKVIKEHRNLPSDSLTSAMSDYVDRMDLSTFGKDDEGNPSEYMPMTDTFSPVLHRIDQAVRWRAVNPTEPIPPPYEILTRYSQPAKDLVAQSKRRLETLMAAADVKKVPPKVQGRRRNRNEVKPLSGLDVEALLGSNKKKTRISAQNAIPDFRQMVNTTDSIDGIREAAQQLGGVIEARIRDSFGDIAYARSLEEIGVMREELTELEEPEMYNSFAKALKRKLLAEELGGNRKDFWWEFRKSKLGLIDQRTLEASTVPEEEAKAFWSLNN
ncbi:MAG: hypothetical protein Q9206_005394 [Seirophora lacunosa]